MPGEAWPWKKTMVAAALVPGAPEEVVEAHLEEGGAGGKGGDVAADARMLAVGAHHHGHGVPADDALDAALDLPGKRGWFAAEMVLRYGVCSFAGSEMPRRAISIWRARRSSAARSPPRVSRT
jgi:hypothetical protein